MIEIPKEFALPKEAFERQRSVLARRLTEMRRHSESRRRRGLATAFAFAVLLGALLVTPAFGVGDRLLDLVHGKPAPAEVKTVFAANDQMRAKMLAFADKAGATLHDRFSPVVASETRGVFAIESSDGPIFLWVAPTEDGRQCWLVQAMATPGGSSSCDELSATQSIRPELLWTEERPNVRIVHARIYDDSITTVDVELEGAPAVSLPVVDSHTLGTVAKDAHVLAFVGRDANHSEVTRFAIR
jgi:hypothetical protein